MGLIPKIRGQDNYFKLTMSKLGVILGNIFRICTLDKAYNLISRF
jgi:hypothetical protein